MHIDFNTLLAILSTSGALIFGYVAFLRGSKRENEVSAERLAIISADIQYVKAAVDDIKKHQDKQDELYSVIVTRVSECEVNIKNIDKQLTHFQGSLSRLRDRVDGIDRVK